MIDADEAHTQLDINNARSIVASHIAEQPELAGKFKNGMPSRGWAVRLLSARGSRLAEACKEHVNGKKIQFLLESEGLEQASDELLSMLGGNKFPSGIMWKVGVKAKVAQVQSRGVVVVTVTSTRTSMLRIVTSHLSCR